MVIEGRSQWDTPGISAVVKGDFFIYWDTKRDQAEEPPLMTDIFSCKLSCCTMPWERFFRLIIVSNMAVCVSSVKVFTEKYDYPMVRKKPTAGRSLDHCVGELCEVYGGNPETHNPKLAGLWREA